MLVIPSCKIPIGRALQKVAGTLWLTMILLQDLYARFCRKIRIFKGEFVQRDLE